MRCCSPWWQENSWRWNVFRLWDVLDIHICGLFSASCSCCQDLGNGLESMKQNLLVSSSSSSQRGVLDSPFFQGVGDSCCHFGQLTLSVGVVCDPSQALAGCAANCSWTINSFSSGQALIKSSKVDFLQAMRAKFTGRSVKGEMLQVHCYSTVHQFL